MFRQRHTVLKVRPFVFVALILMACTSCSSSDDLAPTAPKSNESTQPIFDSDADVLEAAAYSYKRYFELSDEIASRGGMGREGIEALVSPDFLATTYQGFDALAEQALHTSGRTDIKNIILQSHSERNGRADAFIYVCVDVSNVAVLNAAGDDVTPAERPDLLSFEAELTSESKTSANLVLRKNEIWPGDSFC